ncbi:uncharacterized protein LOC110847514 [Folsomia candida]|uniref:Uncharacterized protein n=1 Tax=Folsomia candida TaxID=158441 RepID=A0A226EHZ2_FOLCA|nr:uncharacterized protein LOC110847514 [Folsomia candida]OXA56664.1 hypothetical protein Fcan01_07497 [Folsomia candida]
MSTTRRETKRLFISEMLLIATYFWCCYSLGLGRAQINSDQFHEEYPLKIQALELRLDAVVKDFQSSTYQCAELGKEILDVVAELKKQVSTFHNSISNVLGDGDESPKELFCQSKGNPSRGLVSWMSYKFGPALQIIGLVATIYFLSQLLGALKKSHLPKIEEKWNTFMRKVTFNASFDYMVDVYQPNR